LSEFGLIRHHFARLGAQRGDVTLGVGDDCALLRPRPGHEVAVSIDTLVAGIHFLPEVDPQALGHKCLAVGLSDLAAMGAEPAWATLALTLPAEDPDWLRAFAAGFGALAQDYGVALVGGDTTHGPLSITVQVHGLVPAGQAIRRGGARPGDLIGVSGSLGDAALALQGLLSGQPPASLPPFLRERLERPSPRVALGLALRGLATAMIDLSDGLVADLGHILEESGPPGGRLNPSEEPLEVPSFDPPIDPAPVANRGEMQSVETNSDLPSIDRGPPAGSADSPGSLGAEIRLADLPLSPLVSAHLARTGDWSLPLTTGDDYELCFTLPPHHLGQVPVLAERLGLALTLIGEIRPLGGLRCLTPEGQLWTPSRAGYNHFPDRA